VEIRVPQMSFWTIPETSHATGTGLVSLCLRILMQSAAWQGMANRTAMPKAAMQDFILLSLAVNSASLSLDSWLRQTTFQNVFDSSA